VLDAIPTKLLKEVLPEVTDPLLNIINSSLSLGYVPKTSKLTMIKLLVKNHDLIIQNSSITVFITVVSPCECLLPFSSVQIKHGQNYSNSHGNAEATKKSVL